MNGLEYEREREKRTVDISNMNLSNNTCKAPLVESSVRQGGLSYTRGIV